MKKSMIALLTASMMAGQYAHAQEAAATQPSWADTVEFKGDVRFRLEQIDEDGKDTRDRARIRARLGAEADISDEISAGIALASGNDDPVSSNQTLTDSFSSKDIKLDLAYIDLHPEAIGDGNIVLGKMKMPFIAVNDLQWDGDLNPEGAAVKYTIGVSDTISLLVNGGGFWLEERSSEDETMLYGGQAALQLKEKDFSVLGGASYFYYDNIDGVTPLVDAEDGFGNSLTEFEDIDEVTGEVVSTEYFYANGFEVLELFAKLGFNAGLPVEFAGNYVANQDADEDDTGYMLGLKLGKLKKKGSLEFGYSYRELEANAVVGAFADSDAWNGGTDGKSHKFNLGYQLADSLSAGVTYFISEKGLDDGTDYNRIQIDLVTKF